ncbi:energy transducer TonB [Sulfurimonas microaerophilic]|uniref:energy transducer TonB n=1 Tax=Sulfurimonas microaerophilic TaxID=3058392 RepID=UPI0027155D0C|nr:TonB family protein [Sulfurimonas sp. hsl 1-7]
MNRYIFAFVASLVLYTSLIASIIYIVGNEEEVSQSQDLADTQTVAISVIQQKQCTSKKKHTQKLETQPKNKAPKKVVKKVEKKEKLQPKVEQVKQSKESVEEIVKQEPIEEEVVAQVEEEMIQEENEQEETLEEELLHDQQLQEMIIARQQELDQFTLQLVKKINENKRYPLSARRRGVEGDVDVKFIVLADGGVSAIKVIAGKSIFKNATIQAIESSFPVNVEKSLIDFPQEFQIKLAYTLK